MNTSMDEYSELESEINRWHSRWRLGQRAWSVAHHGSLFGAALLSAGVGAILQLPEGTFFGVTNTSFSTLGSFVAATLATIAGAGGFERKWRANRLSRGRLDVLRIDLEAPNPNLHRVREQLKAAIVRHDEEILGVREEGPEISRTS